MNWQQHYRRAEKLLVDSSSPHAPDEQRDRLIRSAQVHATLALLEIEEDEVN